MSQRRILEAPRSNCTLYKVPRYIQKTDLSGSLHALSMLYWNGAMAHYYRKTNIGFFFFSIISDTFIFTENTEKACEGFMFGFFSKQSKQYASILYKASLHKPIQPDFCINVI